MGSIWYVFLTMGFAGFISSTVARDLYGFDIRLGSGCSAIALCLLDQVFFGMVLEGIRRDSGGFWRSPTGWVR